MILLVLAIITYSLIFISIVIDIVDIHYIDKSFKMMLKKIDKELKENIKKLDSE